MMRIEQKMNDVHCLIGVGSWNRAAAVFAEALQQNADYAWNALWEQTPWAFFEALVPFLLNDSMLHVRSRIVLVNTLLHLCRYGEALSQVSEIERIMPGQPITMEVCARAHAGVGHHFTALQYVNRLEDMLPPERGEEYLEENREIRPLALFKLELLLELGDDTAVEICFGELLSSRLDADVLLSKSFWLRDMGRYSEGLRAAEASLRFHRSSAPLFQCGWLHRALGNSDLAADHFKAFLASPFSPEVAYYRPFVRVYQNKPDKASQEIQAYLATYPDSATSYYLCAEIWSLIGDVELAQDCLQQSFKMGFVGRACLYADPALENVKRTPEGRALLKRRLQTLEEEDKHAAYQMGY